MFGGYFFTLVTKNVFEVVKIMNFINSWFLNAYVFNILDVKMENTLKIMKVQSFLWGVNNLCDHLRFKMN